MESKVSFAISGKVRDRATLSSKRFGATAVAINDPAAQSNRIFIFGGYDGAKYLNTCDLYDAVSNSLTPLPSGARMSSPRSFACAVHLPIVNKIFIFGGFDGTSKLNSAEVFDIETMTFSPLQETMTARRYGACAVAIDDGQSALIMGGHDGAKALKSCETFCAIAGRFTILQSTLSVERCFAAAVNVNGNVVVLGGHDGISRLSTCDRCDESGLQFSAWGRQLTCPRSGLLAVADNATGRIFACGGTDGKSFWDTCEIADSSVPNANFCLLEETVMLQKRSGLCGGLVAPFYSPASRQHKTVFVFGGMDGARTASSFEALTLTSCSHPPGGKLMFVSPALFVPLYASEAAARTVLEKERECAIVDGSLWAIFVCESKAVKHASDVRCQRDVIDVCLAQRSKIEDDESVLRHQQILQASNSSFQSASAATLTTSFCAAAREHLQVLFETVRKSFSEFALEALRLHAGTATVARSDLLKREEAARLVTLDRVVELVSVRRLFEAHVVCERSVMESSCMEALQRICIAWAGMKVLCTIAGGWREKIDETAAQEKAVAVAHAEEVMRKQSARLEVAALHAAIVRSVSAAASVFHDNAVKQQQQQQETSGDSPAPQRADPLTPSALLQLDETDVLRSQGDRSDSASLTSPVNSASPRASKSAVSWMDLRAAREAASAAYAERHRWSDLADNVARQESIARGSVISGWTAWSSVVRRSFDELCARHKAEMLGRHLANQIRIIEEEACRRKELQSSWEEDLCQLQYTLDAAKHASESEARRHRLQKRLKYMLQDEIAVEASARKFWSSAETDEWRALLVEEESERVAIVVATHGNVKALAAGCVGLQIFPPSPCSSDHQPGYHRSDSHDDLLLFRSPKKNLAETEALLAVAGSLKSIVNQSTVAADSLSEAQETSWALLERDAAISACSAQLTVNHRQVVDCILAEFQESLDALKTVFLSGAFCIHICALVNGASDREAAARTILEKHEAQEWETLLLACDEGATLAEVMATRAAMSRLLSPDCVQILAPIPALLGSYSSGPNFGGCITKPKRPLSAGIYPRSNALSKSSPGTHCVGMNDCFDEAIRALPLTRSNEAARLAKITEALEDQLYEEAIDRGDVDAAQHNAWGLVLAAAAQEKAAAKDKELAAKRRFVLEAARLAEGCNRTAVSDRPLPVVLSPQPPPRPDSARTAPRAKLGAAISPGAAAAVAPAPRSPYMPSLQPDRPASAYFRRSDGAGGDSPLVSKPLVYSASTNPRPSRQLVVGSNLDEGSSWWKKIDQLRASRLENERKQSDFCSLTPQKESFVTPSALVIRDPSSRHYREQLMIRLICDFCEEERSSRRGIEIDASCSARISHSQFQTALTFITNLQEMYTDEASVRQSILHAERESTADFTANLRAAEHVMIYRIIQDELHVLAGREASARTFWMLGEHEERQALVWDESRDRMAALIRKISAAGACKSS
jgi:hypothetical protein